jgi:hypothetical protein
LVSSTVRRREFERPLGNSLGKCSLWIDPNQGNRMWRIDLRQHNPVVQPRLQNHIGPSIRVRLSDT